MPAALTPASGRSGETSPPGAVGSGWICICCDQLWFFGGMCQPANTVLVIDDESRIRRLISAGLALHGYAVREAESGAAGLNAAVQIQPDLIILDLRLPDMSGIEVLETIRSWSNVPVIVVSIQSDADVKVHLLKIGADDYVVKPFGIAELAARCEAALRRPTNRRTRTRS
jgi:two-component system KDP operon response regulator KdpE